MKKTFIILLLVLAVSLFAEGWKKTGDFSLLLSQSYYSDNWGGSEMGNINWTGNFNFVMEKQLNEKFYDKNTLLLSFGQTHYQVRDEMGKLSWIKPQITTDLIDYENMLSLTLHKFVDPYISLRWESIFYDSESDSTEIYYINPNILTLSLGAKKVIVNKDSQNLETRLGGAFKNYLNQAPDIEYSNNAGAEVVFAYWYLFPSELGKFDSKLRVYQALITSEDNDNDNWKTADFDFVNNLTFKLNFYIGLKIYFEMLYDKEIDEDIRYKENLGINLSYTLY